MVKKTKSNAAKGGANQASQPHATGVNINLKVEEKKKQNSGPVGSRGIKPRISVLTGQQGQKYAKGLIRTLKTHASGARLRGEAVEQKFKKDADAYAASLVAPEMGIPAKFPDASLVASNVAHLEFDVPITMFPNVTDGSYYGGICMRPALNGAISTVNGSTTSSPTLTWASPVAIPPYVSSAASFTGNFEKYRVVSMAVHLLPRASELYIGGEWVGLRLQMGNNDFAGSVDLPSSWAQVTSTPNAMVSPVTADSHGLRLAYLPLDADQGSFTATASTATTGTALLAVVRAPSDGAYFVARVYMNIEFCPFQDTNYLFGTSSDLGDPSKIVSAIAEAGGFMLQMGDTVAEFERLIGSPGIGTLIRRGRDIYSYLSNLWVNGASGSSSARLIAHFDGILQELHYRGLPADFLDVATTFRSLLSKNLMANDVERKVVRPELGRSDQRVEQEDSDSPRTHISDYVSLGAAVSGRSSQTSATRQSSVKIPGPLPLPR